MLRGGALSIKVNQAGLGIVERRLGLQLVALGDRAGMVLVAHNVERFRVGVGGLLQDILFGVEQSKIEVVRRQRALRREPGVGEVGRRGLGRSLGAFDLPADLAPDVGRPARAQLQLIAGHSLRALDDRPGRTDRDAAVAALLRLGARSGQVDGGEKLRLIGGDDRVRLLVGGKGGGEVLVGDLDLGLEAVEQGIVEDGPPVAAVEAVRRLGRRPALRFLERRRRLDRRSFVVRADQAAAQHRGGEQAGERCCAAGAERAGVSGRVGEHACVLDYTGSSAGGATPPRASSSSSDERRRNRSR